MVSLLKKILEQNLLLKQAVEDHIRLCAEDNPDKKTNPVDSLNNLYLFLDTYYNLMPWEFNNWGESIFVRIDQTTGYIYYLFGDNQYNPLIADWLIEYNKRCAEKLQSPQSWSKEIYNELLDEPLFELNGDKYESYNNWHNWNDFFSRKLASNYSGVLIDKDNCLISPAEGKISSWMTIKEDGKLQTPMTIKTSIVINISDLMSDSPYKESFRGGQFCHVTLDIYNYHRIHSPIEGNIVDLRHIEGKLTSGGKIIWDSNQLRYRYENEDNLGYQMIEKRVVMVIYDKRYDTLVALIPVGVAQVGSIVINEDIRIGRDIRQGQEVGYFQFGGSDVIILKQCKV